MSGVKSVGASLPVMVRKFVFGVVLCVTQWISFGKEKLEEKEALERDLSFRNDTTLLDFYRFIIDDTLVRISLSLQAGK